MVVRLKMKTKLYFIACMVFSTGFFIIAGNHPKSFKTIVKETKVQIDNLKKNFDQKEELLHIEEKYLNHLHLTGPIFYPNSSWIRFKNVSDPVIVSSMMSGQAGDAIHFVKHVQIMMPNTTIFLYDLGLSEHESQLVLPYCNSGKNSTDIEKCLIRPFDIAQFYPAHVHKLRTFAYRPLIIQEILHFCGSVLWLDIDQRILEQNSISYQVFNTTDKGITTWAKEDNIPTSSQTHPKMFHYLVEEKNLVENFNFQHMISLKAMLITSSKLTHSKIMNPWIKCTLIQDCIEPIGAQATGCRTKRPKYRYSGCHSYDNSALNILLGLAFSFDETKYISKEKLFASMDEITSQETEESESTSSLSNDNTTQNNNVTIESPSNVL